MDNMQITAKCTCKCLPLTDEEIKEAVLDDTFGGLALLSMMRDEVMIADVRQAINRIARAIEAAHGIKGEA